MRRLCSCILLFVCAGLLPAATLAAPIYNPATGHWYDYVPGNWEQAEAAAQALGGHLVTINDQAENEWLIDNGFTGMLWIGFYSPTHDISQWEWASGEPVTFVNWKPGEPNEPAREFWAVINFDVLYKWTNARVDYRSWGIAEWEGTPVPEPATLFLVSSGIIGLTGLMRRRASRRNGS